MLVMWEFFPALQVCKEFGLFTRLICSDQNIILIMTLYIFCKTEISSWFVAVLNGGIFYFGVPVKIDFHRVRGYLCRKYNKIIIGVHFKLFELCIWKVLFFLGILCYARLVYGSPKSQGWLPPQEFWHSLVFG